MRRTSHLAAAVSLGLIFAAAPALGQTLEEAAARAHVGDYEQALATLESLALPEPPTEASVGARIALGRLLSRLGRLDRAAELLRPLGTGHEATPAATLGYAEVLAARGQLEEAARLFGLALEAENRRLPEAALLQAEVLARLGRWSAARSNYEDLIAELEAGTLTTGAQLAMAGIAYHRLGQPEAANDVLGRAVQVDPDSVEARVAWANLFLEKYRPDQAREVALEALAINPRDPFAQVALARAQLELGGDPGEAILLAQAALEVNPHLPEAYELLADIAINDEAYGRAIEILGGVLRDNPSRLESLSRAAAAHYLLDERSAYRRLERRVFRLNPGYAEFYRLIAEYASHAFRYNDALDLYQRALDVDSSFWPAYTGLGIGLARQGRDDEALQTLRLALENDPFNERAFRMVNLYEETLPAYEHIESAHFRYRVHRDQRRVLAAYLPDLAEWVYERYTERYGAEPEERVAIEVFADSESFAVRSAGLPHVGPHGVCFGRLITSRSPSEGDFNWAEVLAHELSHVFTLQLSDARVPRWLGEGLADYDTALLRPEWAREADFALLTRLEQGDLPSVDHLNQLFIRTHDVDDIVAAYAQSGLTVQFISERWGEQAPIAMLHLFEERRRLPEVLSEVTGLEVEAFDDAFEAYLRGRLLGLLESFEPSPALFGDEAFYEARVAADPGSAQAHAELAMANLRASRIDECEDELRHALELDPLNPLTNFLAASFAARERRLDEARQLYESLLDDGQDGYTIRSELAQLARRQGRVTDAIAHYREAQRIHPAAVEPYRSLADIYLRSGEQEQAIEQLQRVVLIDQSDFDSALTLIRLLSLHGRNEEAWETCTLALHIDPFDAPVHGLCGQVAVAVAQWERARTELELALALGAPDSALLFELLERVRVELPEETETP